MTTLALLHATDDELLAFADDLPTENAAWAELIRLQVAIEAKESTAADRKRAKQLQKKSRAELLGALCPFVRASSVSFRKGFLDACSLTYTIPLGREAEVARAFSGPLTCRLTTLRADAHVLTLPALRCVRHAALMSDDLRPLYEERVPLEWVTFEGWTDRAVGGLALLERERFPRLRTLRLRRHAGSVADVTSASLSRAVSALMFETPHSNPAWVAGLSGDLEATRFGVYNSPEYQVGKGPDFHAEVAYVRPSADVEWEELHLYAKLFRTLPHVRRPALDWLLDSASNLPRLPERVCLSIEGRNVDGLMEELRSSLASRLSREVVVTTQQPRFHLRASLG